MEIKQINNVEDKKAWVKYILDYLEPWFGIEEAKQEYINKAEKQTVFGCYDGDQVVGFVALNPTSPVTLEIYSMGIHPDYHRKGLGKQLVVKTETYAKEMGFKLLQVKTVQEGAFDTYDLTNAFYKAMGFLPLEVFPTLWDEHCPCQIYVKPLL